MTDNEQSKSYTIQGKMSWFGGPHDLGVRPWEGLALFEHSDIPHYPHLFLDHQPPLTTGVARRLNPDAYYCACRWDYHRTPEEFLRTHKVQITNVRTGESVEAQPADWGPNEHTGRIVDLSPGILKVLGLTTDDIVRVTIPLP